MITLPILPTVRTFGNPRYILNPILTIPQRTEGFPLGWLRWQKKNLFKIYLNPTKPGSWTILVGDQDTDILKTAEKIIREVEKKKKTIMMIDLEGTRKTPIHFNLKTEPDDRDNPLRLNILEIDFANEDSEEVEIITEAFTESLKLTHEQNRIFWNAIRTIYRRRRIEDDDSSHPAISSIITEIQRNIDPQKVSPESSTLLKTLVSLTEGSTGRTLNSKESTYIEDLIKENTLIDLSRVRNPKVKKLIVSVIFASLVQNFKTKVSRQREPQVYLVLKDDGSILQEDKRDQETAQKTLLELRKIGVSLLLIQSSPEQVSSSLIKQCQTKICHRLTDSKDIDLVKNILNIREAEKNIIHELSNREALVKTEYSPQPFKIQILHPEPRFSGRREDETQAEEDILEIISTMEDGKS